MRRDEELTRRDFLRGSASCALHLALMGWATPALARARWTSQARFPVVAEEPWGRIEQITDGIWALVSTPFEDRATLCNGGIVAGRAGLVLVEGFASEAGASWVAEQAERLTGRRPTHVVLSHYHADHTGGLRGAAGGGSRVLATEVTRDLTRARVASAARDLLGDVVLIEAPAPPTEIDLGDRSLIVVPRRGHTASDVTVEIPEESVVFCGDLVWNGMFPNYVDAAPSRLSGEARLLRTAAARVYVPGHGPLADGASLERYVGLLDHVEQAARDALARGLTAEAAGEAYRLPPGLEDWTLFSRGYFAQAIGAWMAELRA